MKRWRNLGTSPISARAQGWGHVLLAATTIKATFDNTARSIPAQTERYDASGHHQNDVKGPIRLPAGFGSRLGLFE